MLPQKYQHHEPIGKQVRFDHEECGDQRSRLYVRRTERGYIYHCHNCAPACSGYLRTDCILSPNETLNLLLNNEGEERDTSDPLADWEFCEVPQYGKEWLKKYTILQDQINQEPNSLITICGARRRGSTQAPCLCFKGTTKKGGQSFLLLRRPVGDAVRYQLIGESDTLTFTRSQLHSGTKDYGSTIVLVEDLVSAIKVSEHCRCAALLGSNVSNEVYQELFGYDKVVIWLDYDKYRESQDYSYRGRLFGLDCVALITEKDPKDYTAKEIQCHLQTALS